MTMEEQTVIAADEEREDSGGMVPSTRTWIFEGVEEDSKSDFGR